MKVPASIRNLFEDQKAINVRLKQLVDSRILSIKHDRWHYESRVKELPSFALKLESGRFPNPRALEDFFACTLVVAKAADIAVAEQLIGEHFSVKRRRPHDLRKTHKSSDSFPFDDLRLYVSLREDPTLPPNDLTQVLFELQIKTFLQHAWSIATHDLVYKTDDANWSKERIAYQTKAMLEHAEISIQAADKLSDSDLLKQEDAKTADLKKGIALLKKHWAPAELPTDVRRLAENMASLLKTIRVDSARLEAILNEEKSVRGSHPTNLSPYSTIVQYLFTAERAKILEFLVAKESRGNKLLIPSEIELPAGVRCEEWCNAIRVGATSGRE